MDTSNIINDIEFDNLEDEMLFDSILKRQGIVKISSSVFRKAPLGAVKKFWSNFYPEWIDNGLSRFGPELVNIYMEDQSTLMK